MRVVVVHREAAEAAALVDRLRRDGFDAEPYPGLGPRHFKDLRANPPDAVLIDLMRMPSYGKAMGALLREGKGTRSIPIVFLEGDPAKTAVVKALLPDAGFAPLSRLGPALRRAIQRPPADPLLPQLKISAAQKLRIGEGAQVAMIGAPDGFAIDPLPPRVRFTKKADAADVVLLFAKFPAILAKELPKLSQSERPLWVLWPKRASKTGAPISFPGIKDVCEPLGLTAYKTCSVDATWSAAAIAKRRRERPKAEG